MSCLVMAISTCNAAGDGKVVGYSIGGHELCLPMENVANVSKTNRKHILMGFSPEVIKAAIPEYNPGLKKDWGVMRLGISLSIDYLPIKEYKNLYDDRWYRSGNFKDSEVQKDNLTGFYRLRKKDDLILWNMLKINPIEQKNKPVLLKNWYIGSCVKRMGDDYKCNRFLYVDDLELSYYIHSSNLHLLNKLDQFIESKLESWKCESN